VTKNDALDVIECLKCSTLALTHAIRWWRNWWTACAWHHGLASPTQ